MLLVKRSPHNLPLFCQIKLEPLSGPRVINRELNCHFRYIVGGVLAFVVIVAILVLVFCCCCKDGKCTGTCGGMNCCGYSGVSTD